MILTFYLIDRNDRYEVAQANEIAGEFGIYALSDYRVLEITDFELYAYVKQLLSENKQVFLPKYDYDKKYDKTDVIVLEENELDIAKRIADKRINSAIYGRVLTKANLMDIYNFTILNNWFIDKGFVITDDNRESKYLEIISYISDIESEDDAEAAIDRLQEYLNCKDRLDYAKNVLIGKRSVEMKIDDAETEEEVKEIADEFLLTFDS